MRSSASVLSNPALGADIHHILPELFDLSLGMQNALTLLCLSLYLAGFLSPSPGLGESLEELVRRAGVHPGSVGLTYLEQRLLSGSRGASPASLMIEKPLKGWDYLRPVTLQLKSASRKRVSDMLPRFSILLDRPVFRDIDRSLPLSWIEESRQTGAVEQMLKRVSGKEQKGAAAGWPPELQRAVFILLYSELHAGYWANLALESVPLGAEKNLWEVKKQLALDMNGAKLSELYPFYKYRTVLFQFDLTPLLTAAEDIFFCVEKAVELLRKMDKKMLPPDFKFLLKTRYGLISINGAGDDNHAFREPVLLQIDLGGDDVYNQAGANDNAVQAVSISIDLAGDDIYENKSSDTGSFGAGTFGVGVLWDDEGNDRYRGISRSQASAYFGVGILVDRTGDDFYEAEIDSQGSATAGVSLLIDLAGSDRYYSYSYSQGYAGPFGAALLFDGSGDDTYLIEDKDIKYRAPQTAEHNISMSQGASSGIRSDLTDGLSLPGGAGMLLDAGGNDSYAAGVFAQGVGYWQGLGALVDTGGDDKYRGQWYVQGASAHFSFGILVDEAGNDRYQAAQHMALGAAHDLSGALFVDSSGDDVYLAPALALGASSSGGTGIFLERSGDDSYYLGSGKSVGWVAANPPEDIRSSFSSYGLFFDLKGRDSYEGDLDPVESEFVKRRILSKRYLRR